MKTIQELYNEVLANEELKAKCIEAAGAGKLEAFIREQGCGATLEEVTAFLEGKDEEDAPLSVDELENTAGGGSVPCEIKIEISVSICTAGIGCAYEAIKSASQGYVGIKKEGDGRLCNRE
ncbi:MAG: hypothetical protein IKO25_01240 [Clostridia bacterium]|nr:hypothetical protein [Clostridia bacterium]